MKRNIDLDIAKLLRIGKEPDNKLKLNQENQDTSFDIFYDIFYKDNERYFYIIMQENTANAPFYYIRSYTIKDLHDINKIFKVFEENNFEEIKGYMKTLFEKKKIVLTFELNSEDIINMELNVVLFANPDKINLKLYREMIPQEEKDQKLLDLYNLQKNKNQLLKEIKSIIESNIGNKQNKEIINNIAHILTSLEIPGIEDLKEDKKEEKIEDKKEDKKEEKIEDKKEDKIENKKEEKEEAKIEIKLEVNRKESNEEIKNEIKEEKNIEIKEEKEEEKIMVLEEAKVEVKEENDLNINIEDKKKKEDLMSSDIPSEINAQMFPDLRKVYNFSKKNGNFNIFLTIKNIFDEDWPQGSFKLVYNEEKSHIRCKEVINCAYDIGKGQDGDFIVCFDGKDLKPGKKYKCCLQLYVNQKKVTDEDAIFKIRISD